MSIYLTDDVVAAMAPWRDEINVSAVCQEALRAEVARLEDEARKAWHWTVFLGDASA